MGKGRIVSVHGEGRYTLEILEDRSRAESSKALAASRLQDLGSKINDLESDLADAQRKVDIAADAQDQAIAEYRAALVDGQGGGADARQAMLAAGEAVAQAATKRDAVRGQIRAAKAERLSLQTRIDRISALPALRQIEAWCADYTEDLSGEVATAEVPGEIGQIVIKPGFEGANRWSPSADGAIQPALSGTPASVFYNLAMLPGWQKWRPTFRIATVSNIDNDLCDITLDAATSSQQGLGVNSRSSYSGVPIAYMDCNGDAFEDGDRVLVAFSGNTNKPMVVGFEQEPKECFREFYHASKVASIYDDSATVIRYQAYVGAPPEEASSIEYLGVGSSIYLIDGTIDISQQVASYPKKLEESIVIETPPPSATELGNSEAGVKWQSSVSFKIGNEEKTISVTSYNRVEKTQEEREGTWLLIASKWQIVEATIEYDGVTVDLSSVGRTLFNSVIQSVPDGMLVEEGGGVGLSPSYCRPNYIENIYEAKNRDGGIHVTVGVMVTDSQNPKSTNVFFEEFDVAYVTFVTPRDGATYRIQANRSPGLPDDSSYPES